MLPGPSSIGGAVGGGGGGGGGCMHNCDLSAVMSCEYKRIFRKQLQLTHIIQNSKVNKSVQN